MANDGKLTDPLINLQRLKQQDVNGDHDLTT